MFVNPHFLAVAVATTLLLVPTTPVRATADYGIGQCTLNSQFPGTLATVDLEPSVDNDIPLRFTWTLQNPEKGASQSQISSFEIIDLATGKPVYTLPTSTDTEPLLVLPLANVSHVLQPATQYLWNVSVTMLPQGVPTTPCSGKFETAPSRDVFPGKAQWIGGGGLLTAKFQTPTAAGNANAYNKTITSARAYVSGVGAFYLFINGARTPVGENFMDPQQTVYSKRVVYRTFDLTSELREGENEVAVLLGNYKWGYNDIWCDMIKVRAGGGISVENACVRIGCVFGVVIGIRKNQSG